MKNIFYVNVILTTLLLLYSCVKKSSVPTASEDTISVSTTGKKISIVERIKENPTLSVQQRIELYQKLKNESPEKYDFSNEDELTMFGYSYLWSDMIDEAIAVFKLIVQEFPGSSNSYDSLGEAYLASGDKKKGLLNYERSFSMDPNNFNAEDIISRIKNPDQKIESFSDKFDKTYSVQEYQEDLDQLGNRLLEIHLNALKFITKENFHQLIEDKKALISNETTYGEFNWICSEIIASLNCSHTGIADFYPEIENLPNSIRFPLQTRWTSGKLYVINPLNNNDKVKTKDEIISINGVNVKTIIQEIYKHIPSQGYVETSKKHYFNRWSTGLIPFALNSPENYVIQTSELDELITLKPAEYSISPLSDPSIKRCEDLLCLEIKDDIAIMTISSFNYYPWNNLNVFQEFMDEGFKEINEKKVKHLVIDVRFNGGGSAQSSIYLLKYLSSKPFSYYSEIISERRDVMPDFGGILEPFENNYKGKLYFIIDGLGKSTTGHFMSLVKVLELGEIIGEELGSNHFCSAGQNISRLKNTKLVYYIANNTHVSATTSKSDEIGVLPDYEVIQNIDDYLNKVDVVKAFTLNLIDK